MIELNHTTETDSGRGEARVTWPALPAEPGEAAGNAPSPDRTVGVLLERLSELPDLPVALHGEVYAGLHDELLAALNESVTGQAAGEDDPAQTTISTGDATNEQA